MLTLAIGAVLVAIPIVKGYKLNFDFDELDKSSLKDVPSKLTNIFQYNVIYISYLAYGIATIVTGLIGCFAISKNNCFARWIYCTITLVMAVVAGCSIYISQMYHDDFFKQMSKGVRPKTFIEDIQLTAVDKLKFQEIQDSLRCCGLITPKNVSDTCFGWNDPKRPNQIDVHAVCACQPASDDFDKTCIGVKMFDKKFGKNCVSHKGNFVLPSKLIRRKTQRLELEEEGGSGEKQGHVYGRGCLNVIWEWVDVSLYAVFGINVLATLATCWLCSFDNKSDKTESTLNLVGAY